MKIAYPLLSKSLCLLLIISACKQSGHGKKEIGLKSEFATYSTNVKDSFYISVQLPLEYQQQPNKRYPTVYVTDANFYYPMLASVLHQYEKGGLLPPLILVGIGYKSFKLMDSLRVRDYLYPKAISSDEMKAIGGGQHFYQFITGELLPQIDTSYRTKTSGRALLGHSFGGYFSLYALLEQINKKRKDFSSFVSASPSLWYNNNYLFQIPKKLSVPLGKDSLNIFLSVGGMEDPKWSVVPFKDLSKRFADLNNKVRVNTEVYTNLDHMDVGLISFIHSLETIYNNPAK